MIKNTDYKVSIVTESIALYGDGGCFPIYIHDELNHGRYKIQNKIGVGGHSMVWSALDQQYNKWVSIKVIRARDSQNNQELALLQHLKHAPPHPGKKHLPTLLDFLFEEKDRKNCLFIVMELLGPDMRIIRTPRWPLQSRNLTTQLCQAISCLHSNGIVHADIYENNILARPPADWDPSSITPYVSDVTRKDGVDLEPGIPTTVVGLPYYLDYPVDLDYKEIVLIDLSSAFRYPENSPISVDAADHVIAPEAIFCKPLTFSVDVWKLGCMAYYFIYWCHVFDDWSGGREILPVISRRLGNTASPWLLQSLLEAIHEGIWKDVPSCKWFPDMDTSAVLEQEVPFSDSKAISFLRKCLVVDPTERPTIEDILAEESSAGGYLHNVG